MTFRFNGQEFNTDKRIFVLGYQILKTWFPYDNDPHDKLRITEYGPTVKSFYVRSILFDTQMVNGRMQNVVTGLKFDFNGGVSYVRTDHIIGHSSEECLKIYQERI